jgi:hypothetical protein
MGYSYIQYGSYTYCKIRTSTVKAYLNNFFEFMNSVSLSGLEEIPDTKVKVPICALTGE